MQLIKTYKAVINHQLGYTMTGRENMIEHANLKRLKKFIFPLLDELQIGKKLPKDLNDLSNKCWVDLSYVFSGETYMLVLIVEDNKLKCVSKTNFFADNSEENADGYYDFMKDFD